MSIAADSSGRSPDSARFWQGVRDGQLLLPYCRSCRRPHFPPMPGCPSCGQAGGFDFRPASGRGRVYTWTVTYWAFWPEIRDQVPYTTGIVTLDAGPRVYGRIDGVPPDADLTDLAVAMRFPAGEPDGAPYFVPAQT